ncbi:MAG TPA: hypothetical protein VK053_07685 [Jiangellaceae bacterium]|nr:hypothetical protein [Jiangellaceae bacterium]
MTVTHHRTPAVGSSRQGSPLAAGLAWALAITPVPGATAMAAFVGRRTTALGWVTSCSDEGNEFCVLADRRP